MAGLITYSSVLLLARKRLERVEKLLRGKVLSGGTVNEIERQVLFLASTALRAMNATPGPATGFPPDSFAPWLAKDISQFAVMGSTGPEIVKFAAQHIPNQEWLFDTLRHGNPDPQRSHVLAKSTDVLVKFCERVVTNLNGQPDNNTRRTLLNQLRAYALGYGCHLAGAVAAAPFVDAVEFELGAQNPSRERLSVQAVRSAIEEGVARQVYRRSDPRGGDWNGWLPSPDQVPAFLFEAYTGAVADVFGAGARVEGSHAFNQALTQSNVPPLDAALVRDGYASYRLLAERGYVWSYGDWLLSTLFMFVWPALMFPFAAALPQGRHLRRDDEYFVGKPPEEQRNNERSIFEVLTFPLAANGVVPLALTLWLMLGSYRGAAKEIVFGIVNGVVVLVAAIVFFATLGTDMPDWARWLFLFALPLALEIAHIAFTIAVGRSGPRRAQLVMSSMSHILVALVFVICFVGFLHFGVEGFVDDGFDSGAYWGLAVAWLGIVAVLWLVISAILYKIDGSLPAPRRIDFASGQKHFLRLFDDATLGTALVPTPPASLAQKLFPNERQPILKLWWTGTDPLFIRSTRDTLEFSFVGDGTGPKQVVLAPLAPMTAREYGVLLKKSVQNKAGAFSGELKVEPFEADEPLDPQLSTGQVFADHGDDKSTVEEHDAERIKFRPIPASDKDPYVLALAPRSAVAIFMGRGGSLLLLGGAAAAGAGTLNAVAAPGSVNVVGDANARFLETFIPGDVIELTPAPGQARVVVAVLDDQHLTVNFAFAPFGAPQTYQRRARDRETDFVPPAAQTVATDNTTFRQLLGIGTSFEQIYMPGDRIQVAPPLGGDREMRTVVSVISPTLLLLDIPFSESIPSTPIVAPAVGAAFQRPGRVNTEGLDFVPPDPTALFAGESVLDRAADLATLLCLGVTSHSLLDSERAAVAAAPNVSPDTQHAAVGKAWQVLRNWNVDHRRVNEWRMLVTGGAVSEKHGVAKQRDVLQPAMPAAHETPASVGEPLANQLGWIPLFTNWLEMASHSANNTVEDRVARPGVPSNLQLSRGVAFLLDLPSPV
jgi:hypothetical protein